MIGVPVPDPLCLKKVKVMTHERVTLADQRVRVRFQDEQKEDFYCTADATRLFTCSDGDTITVLASRFF